MHNNKTQTQKTMSKKNKTCTEKELINQIFDSIIVAKTKLDELSEQSPATCRAVAKAVMGISLQHFGSVIYADFEKDLDIDED